MTTSSSQKQQRQQNNQPPPPSTGGVFKLKIKLNSQPQQQQKQQQQPIQQQPQQQQQQQQQQKPPHQQHQIQSKQSKQKLNYHPIQYHPNGEDDDQEDQLAGSSVSFEEEEKINPNQYQYQDEDEDSLSSVPPQPEPIIKKSSKFKSKVNPTSELPPSKKRKTLPINSTTQSIPPQQTTEITPNQSKNKIRTIRPPQASSNIKLKSTRSNVAPLTDAELLSAAGSQYLTEPHRPKSPLPTHNSNQLPIPSKPIATKKKKSTLDPSKKPIDTNLNPSPIPQSKPNNPQPPIIQSPQVVTKTITVTKSKSKKGQTSSRPSQSKGQPDPFQPAPTSTGISAPIARPPPQPRPQHNYSVGPPPPPPVPVFKPFTVGPAPRVQAQFLPAQILEKRTPKVRSWKKIKRQVIGISGIPFWVWTYAGDEHSDYASFKKNKIPQAAGTPNSTQDPQHVPLVPQSRPASVASSHAQPSPNRNSAATRNNVYKTNSNPENNQNAAANLGGPVLPASFRRAPVSIVGSPLGNQANNQN